MIRLFTGLAIPADIAADISLLRGGLTGARWIDETDYHLTLQFIGNIEESIADELHEALSRIRLPPVELILESLHVFGGEKPRSIVIGVRSTPSLVNLHKRQRIALERLNIESDTRKYVPHITVARLKSLPAPAVAEFIDSRRYFRPRTFVADRFILFSAARSAGGGPYVAEAQYALRE